MAISTTGMHNLALKSNGTIVAWGNNDYGQCEILAPNADFVAVAAGAHHSLGLKSDGTIVSWGRNDWNECDVPEPNEEFTAITPAWGRSLAVKESDTPVEGSFFASPTPDGDAIVVRWLLPEHPGGAGLTIHRALSADGPYARVTEDPLPNDAAGSYVDDAVWPGGTFWYELRVLMLSGEELPATGMRATATLPGELEFRLRYVAPNPTSTRTTVGCALPEGWLSARLAVHDAAGRLVRRLNIPEGARGHVEVDWDGTDSSGERVASGVYFIRLEVDGEIATDRVVLLR